MRKGAAEYGPVFLSSASVLPAPLRMWLMVKTLSDSSDGVFAFVVGRIISQVIHNCKGLSKNSS